MKKETEDKRMANNLSISSTGLAVIKKYEGCRLTAYKCPAGVWTIGYGHTAGVKEGMKITQAQAESYLKADCASAEKAVNSYNSKYNWNQNQFDALVSFTFNCGSGNLRNLLKNGARTIAEISAKIPAYNKGGSVVLPGLVKRRAEEKALFDKAAAMPAGTALPSSAVSATAATASEAITASAAKTKVTYITHRISDNKWGNEIVGYNTANSMGYSGVLGKSIDKVAIKLSKGTITYIAHRTDGKWGGTITGYSTTDTNKYAGSAGKPIDAVAMKASGIVGTLKYRVHRKSDNKWGSWITGYSTTDTNKYAGSFGKEIDAIQIGIE